MVFISSTVRKIHRLSRSTEKLNRWYDHGLGKGGNLVDFGILYNDCTVKDFLELIATSNIPIGSAHPSLHGQENVGSQLVVLHETSLKSAWLLNYLKFSSCACFLWRENFCRELTYKNGEKIYNAIAFKNDSTGFELRNPSFKGSTSPKDVTTFLYGSNQMTVFEGFFDFLSFTAMLSSGVQKTE